MQVQLLSWALRKSEADFPEGVGLFDASRSAEMGTGFADFGDDVSWHGPKGMLRTIVDYLLSHPKGKVFLEKWTEGERSTWDSSGLWQFRNLSDDELQVFDEILDDLEKDTELTKHWNPIWHPARDKDFVAFREKLRERWWGFRL